MADSDWPPGVATLEDVLANIRDPRRWMDPDQLVDLLAANPSLRGMAYGYVAEAQLKSQLQQAFGVTDAFKPDDHQRAASKSDVTFTFHERRYTIQAKSMQTNSIKQVGIGQFTALIQNDASDRRPVPLPDGTRLETTCYLVGEYDILAVSLQPFTGTWDFAFRANRNLPRSTYVRYSESQRLALLATLVPISWPLGPEWTTDLSSLLRDPALGRPVETSSVTLPTTEATTGPTRRRRDSSRRGGPAS
jgi:hypothetical protein